MKSHRMLTIISNQLLQVPKNLVSSAVFALLPKVMSRHGKDCHFNKKMGNFVNVWNSKKTGLKA